jgi:hypothetical protein
LTFKEGVDVKMEGQDIIVSSPDKELAGMTAGAIELICRRPGFDPRILHGVAGLDPHKGLFARVETDVRLRNPSSEAVGELVEGVPVEVKAWVYTLLPYRLPKTAKLIEGGDWRRSLEEFPALPMRLTERQKAYIRRLAQCSGRDIVPIDMALYRELLHLDLVVDKGRRLALTGHARVRFEEAVHAVLVAGQDHN